MHVVKESWLVGSEWVALKVTEKETLSLLCSAREGLCGCLRQPRAGIGAGRHLG